MAIKLRKMTLEEKQSVVDLCEQKLKAQLFQLQTSVEVAIRCRAQAAEELAKQREHEVARLSAKTDRYRVLLAPISGIVIAVINSIYANVDMERVNLLQNLVLRNWDQQNKKDLAMHKEEQSQRRHEESQFINLLEKFALPLCKTILSHPMASPVLSFLGWRTA